MGIRVDFARNLRRLRAEKGISQEELAHRADLDRTYISYIENQRYAVTIDVLERLARSLGTNPSDLILTKSQRRKDNS